MEGFLLGNYAPDFEGAYHRVAQTFKLKKNHLTRIEIKIKRMLEGANDSTITQSELINKNNQKDIWYYLTKVDKHGVPDLSKRFTGVKRIRKNEVDYFGSGQNNFKDIDFISLYFDPTKEGNLPAGTEIALILEYGVSDVRNYSNGELKWEGGHYRVATVDNAVNAPMLNGKLFKGWHTEFSRGWSKPYNKELLCNIYSPSSDTVNAQMHDYWVDFQCSIISKMVSEI